MTVETNANYINELNRAYPRNRDLIKEGDDHIRLLKSTIQNTFPGVTGAVEASSAKLNTMNKTFTYEDDLLQINDSFELKKGKSCSMGGAVINNVGDPKEKTDAVNLQSLQGTLVWPVGSIFMTVDSRNPRDILGFGNWSKFAAGRVIIGTGSTTDVSSNTQTFVNEQKGGEFLHTITADELPSHTHTAKEVVIEEGGKHRHNFPAGGGSSGAGGRRAISIDTGINNGYDWAGETEGGKPATNQDKGHTHKATITLNPAGKSAKMPLIQPFIACNIWVRNPDE